MEESTLDIKDIIKTIKKRQQIIFKIFLGFILSAFLLSLLLPKAYEAETTLRIKQPKGLANSLLSEFPTGIINSKQQMSTYAEILKSRSVIQEVIEKTHEDKGVIPSYESMRGRIATIPVKDTELLKITVQARSPEEAQLLANTVVETFMGRMTALVRAEQGTIREFIGERLDESRKDLERAETALEQYKRTAKIVAPDIQTQMAVNRFSDLTKLQAENAVAQVSAQARLASINQELGEEKPGFIADSPLIQQYQVKLADLGVELVTLLEKYTEKHPQVIATRAAIADTTGKLDTEIARVINAEAPSLNPVHQGLLQGRIQSKVELAAALAQRQALDRIMAAGENQLMTLPSKEQGLAKLMRDAAVAQEIYIMLAKRHEEARISEVMQPTDVQVVDAANLPDHQVAPRVALNVVIAAFLGLFVGLTWVLFPEYMVKSIRSQKDVEQYLALPILGNIPDFEEEYEQPNRQGIWARLKQLVQSGKNIQGSVQSR